jgi:hypothetical protein
MGSASNRFMRAVVDHQLEDRPHELGEEALRVQMRTSDDLPAEEAALQRGGEKGQALSRSAPRLSFAKAMATSDISATTMMKIPTGT